MRQKLKSHAGGVTVMPPSSSCSSLADWPACPEFLALSKELRELGNLLSNSVMDLDKKLNEDFQIDTVVPSNMLQEITGVSTQLPASGAVKSTLSLNYTSSKPDEGDVRGIRLKFGRDAQGQFKSSDFGDSLGIPHSSVRVFESEEDATVLFLKVQGFSSEWNSQTSEDIAWKIFGQCKDRTSALYHFNRGEVFCRHPFDIEPHHQVSTDGALEDCVGTVLAAGGGIEESASQTTFVRFCREIRKQLGSLDSDAKYLDQLCADAMMVMGPFITTMARHQTPKFDQTMLDNERVGIRDLSNQYLGCITGMQKWDSASEKLERTLKLKLMAHVEAVNTMRLKIQSDLTHLSLRGGRGENRLDLAQEQGLRIAKQLQNESQVQEMSVASKLRIMQAKVEGWDAEKEKALLTFKYECAELERQLAKLQREREVEAAEITRRLMAYQQQSQTHIALAREVHAVRLKERRLQAEAEVVATQWREHGEKLQGQVEQWGRISLAGRQLEQHVEEVAAAVRSEHASRQQGLAGADVPLDILYDLIRHLTSFLCLLTDRLRAALRANKPAGTADARKGEVEAVIEEELREAEEALESQMTPLWSHLQGLSSVTAVCVGSQFELLVMSTPGHDGYLDLPHPRALRAQISLTAIQKATRSGEAVELDDKGVSTEELLAEAVKAVVVACTGSPQFEKEMMQVAAEHKRAGEMLSRLRAKAATARIGAERTSKEEEARREEVRAVEQKVVVLEREVGKSRREMETAEADCRGCEEVEARLERERREQIAALAAAEAAMAKAKKMLDQNEKAKKEAKDKAKSAAGTLAKRQAAYEQKKMQLSKAVQQRGDIEHALQQARRDAEGRRDAGGEAEWELREVEEAVRVKREVVDRYRHIGGMGKTVLGQGQDGWVVRPDEMVIRVNVWLEFREALKEVAGSERRERAFKRAVEESVRRHVTDRCGRGGRAQGLAKRVWVEGLERSLAGGAEVNLVFLEDDEALPAQAMIAALREALFPASGGPAGEIGIGEGRSGGVRSLRVRDPLGVGRAGEVREAQVGQRRVVVKEVRVFGERERLAVMRGGQLTQEVTARVTALCRATHPALLPYQGVCFHDCQPGLPFFSVLQDFCPSSLAAFLSQNHSPHDPSAELPLPELHAIFHALDPSGKQQLRLRDFMEGLEGEAWVRQKLGLSASAAAYRKLFAALDREGSGQVDVSKLVRYLGPRARGDRQVPWAQRMQIAVDVAKGMGYLQGHGIVHGSLSSHNVGLRQGLRVQIMDFGLSHVLAAMPQAAPLQEPGGAGAEAERGWMEERALAWVSPEQLCGGEGEGGGDAWSYGVVLWELLTGEVPWAGKSGEELRAMAAAAGGEEEVCRFQLPVPTEAGEAGPAPAGFEVAMRACWAKAPWQRPSFAALIRTLVARQSEWPRHYLPA